ncbi:helicase-related protein [Herpetosiphon giganteus]|uniref:helicase-related protein n=1 Tax=Herpetosiphon giganteus TaxID=2029754 RepID=UPI0019583933|nr:helicase-related protein [Herpetosiphon giganteus]MBM7841618.1 hypothetical protein [Herpetosiphon giganteus]
MDNHHQNRKYIVDHLRAELVGPMPEGREIDTTKPVRFDDQKQAYGPWKQAESGEEILIRDVPHKRYGIGVLYPFGTLQEPELSKNDLDIVNDPIINNTTQEHFAILTEDAYKAAETIAARIDVAETEEMDLSTANSYKPSSMGVSFLADLPNNSMLVVHVTGGRYRQQAVSVQEREQTWWCRSSISGTAIFTSDELKLYPYRFLCSKPVEGTNLENFKLNIEVYSRPTRNLGERLLTISLVNRNIGTENNDQSMLFQSHFKVTLTSDSLSEHDGWIHPYPSYLTIAPDAEEQSLSLLYRHAEIFATGHGCAADWGIASTSLEKSKGYVGWVSAECLPCVETPSITPDILDSSGEKIIVPMAPLAGLIATDDGFQSLDRVIEGYETWIKQKQSELEQLAPQYQAAAQDHLNQCRTCANRMRDGVQYLRTNSNAEKAFRLANHAMLLQQVRANPKIRYYQYDSITQTSSFSEPFSEPDLLLGNKRGNWRPFQIAFLLMSLQSTADGNIEDRRMVELIWFPTGGGKTEAYLGLAAFSIFFRRLIDPRDTGVQVLMRYTLRLLTAQQFQRAAGLICAMEYLRRQNQSVLGVDPLTIGIWLGSSITPNTRKDARNILAELRREQGENKFILTRCPWCRAQIGPIKSSAQTTRTRSKRKRDSSPTVVGYETDTQSVIFRCSDEKCPFHIQLPVYVIDEDVYLKRPSLVIGTVDKFAMLAWKSEARSLFGLEPDGSRNVSPPGLIIQDELHLISGPLGSIVGLYEAAIEDLCTDKRKTIPIPPKIVSSTATIRRYHSQIKSLYARDKVTLFPPSGLEAGDSYFARYARNSDGTLQPGRLFVGVHGPSLGSMQTVQVRTLSTLLQAPVPLNLEERDPWWTLLTFFNSLRELGTTLTLLQSDIPDYLAVLRQRMGYEWSEMRHLWNIKELTSRLQNDEIPAAITALEASCTASDYPVDVCLASSIIEVGVDIDRLSLMAIVGQPKTTAQYIQVSGRVGRQWIERPGLVVTMYGASKPRDRSHFEKFRSYHERLYAQVEPTSVTPFSPPVLERALHAVMAVFVRQYGDEAITESPRPFPVLLLDSLYKLLHSRIKAVDPAELNNFNAMFEQRRNEWQTREPREWKAVSGSASNPGLLRVAGSYVSRQDARLSWPTAQSMRDVDAMCEAIITRLYALGDADA